VTDSAADLTPAAADAAGIAVVPLAVSFGKEQFRAGADLTTEEFWQRMTAPQAPFPKTAAASAGDFQTVFERCLAGGADSIVCVDVAGTLSGTIKAAMIARDELADREIHVVDSGSASMGTGLLALIGAEMAAGGASASSIVAALEDRKTDLNVYFALDTVEYLKRGGRISGTQAAIGTLLSVKPIITIKDGLVETVDKVRTRSKARGRAVELLTDRPVERMVVLHTMAEDVDAFRQELLDRVSGPLDPSSVDVYPIGSAVGSHLGPGGIGAAVLYAQ
jgi:DegV family protein with EDD domain